jgi:hypothetical protein
MADYNSSYTGTQIDDATDKVLNLEQTTGTGTAVIMSQKVVTDELDTKVNSEDLAAVATSGSYDDLSNKPSVPATPISIENGGTGATTAAGAQTNLGFTGAVSLPDNTDFNTIKGTALYLFTSSVNTPNGAGGKWSLITIFPNSTQDGTQIATKISTGDTFIRTMYVTTWQSWRKFTTTAV